MFFNKHDKPDYETISMREAIVDFNARGAALGDPQGHLTQEMLNSTLNDYRSALASTDKKTLQLAEDIRVYLLAHGYGEQDIKATRAVFDQSYRMIKRQETSQSLLWRTKISLWLEKLLRFPWRRQ